jgi:hypothetical protein
MRKEGGMAAGLEGDIVGGMEGVIRFDLDYRAAPPLAAAELQSVNAWRRILFLLRLIGRDPGRYGGLGYGNISRRLAPPGTPPEVRRFVISGTQTGGLAELAPEHYAVVLECRPEENRVVAEGPVRPSAEALTHGALYAAADSLQFVMHVHSPDLWRQARGLGVPVTAEVPYGSPAMALEVKRLLADSAAAAKGLFAMGGHEDGIVAFGHSAEAAGTVLLRYFARALGDRE